MHIAQWHTYLIISNIHLYLESFKISPCAPVWIVVINVGYNLSVPLAFTPVGSANINGTQSCARPAFEKFRTGKRDKKVLFSIKIK